MVLLMKISDYLRKELIFLNIEKETKKEVIKEIAEFMKSAKDIINFEEFLKDIFEREEISSTGIGEGIAIPHARTLAVSNTVICFARTKKEIEFDSIDNKPVRLIFMIGAPKEDIKFYLKVLASLTFLLKKKSLKQALIKAKNEEEVLKAFRKAEETQ